MLNHISKPQILHKPPHALYAAVCALHVLQCTLLEATEKVEIYKSFSMPQSRDALFV